MATRIQLRRDTAANWTTNNPTLASGEVGFETNTNKFKIGNGSSTWSALSYFGGEVDLSGYLTASSASTTYLTQASASTTYATKTELNNIDLSSASAAAVAAIVDSAPSTLNTLNELAAALGDDANYASTITTALGNKLDISTASSEYVAKASPTLTGSLTPRTGGTGAGESPIRFNSGSLLTTPVSGAIEYTSTGGFYITENPGTSTGPGRGKLRAPQMVYSLANSLAATTTTPVSAFYQTNDVLSSLEGSTHYRFSGKYYTTSTFTSGTANIQLLFAFSYAPNEIRYSYKTYNQTAATTTMAAVGSGSAITAIQVSPAITSTVSYVVEFDGYFRTSAEVSTFRPQFQMSATGSSTIVTAGSYIEIEKLGAGTTVIAGNWI